MIEFEAFLKRECTEFLSFASLDCLNYPIATPSDIFEFEIRYACQLFNEESLCENSNLNETQCALALERGEDKEDAWSICRQLLTRFSSQEATNCFLTAVGESSDNLLYETSDLDIYTNQCYKTP